MYQAALDGKRVTDLKQLKKFTSKYDLFVWDEIDSYRSFILEKNVGYHTFGFKLFTGGLFGGMTETGKMFVQQLRQMISGCGMKLSFKWDGLVTDCKISYTCNIPGGYIPKEKIGKPKMNLTQAEAEDALITCLSKFKDSYYKEAESGGIGIIKVDIPLTKVVLLYAAIDATNSSFSVCIHFGRASATQVDLVALMVNDYNAEKSDDDFTAKLIEKDSSYRDLMFAKIDTFIDEDDLVSKLETLITAGIELCQSAKLYPFALETEKLMEYGSDAF